MQSDSETEKHTGIYDSSTDNLVRPDELTTFRLDVLAVLATGVERATAIRKPLDDFYQSHNIQQRVYTTLNWLAERDLVAVGEIDARTNKYELTDAGREVLERHHEWREQMLSGVDSTDSQELEGSA